MRIVVDMQGTQTASRFRDIGHYTIGLARGLVSTRGEHEVFLVLNGMLSDSIDHIRAEFEGILPGDNIRVWYAPVPLGYKFQDSFENRSIALCIYSDFLLSLKPDVVLSCSMIEGWGDDFFCDFSKIKGKILTACIIYDFVPYKYPDSYLNSINKIWYNDCFSSLASVDIFLTVSEFIFRETKKNMPHAEVVTISSFVNSCFIKRNIDNNQKNILFNTVGITKPFILYFGGLDERKNVNGLFIAFNNLPEKLRSHYQLVVPCGAQAFMMDTMKQQAARVGLSEEELCLCEGLSDVDLCTLYSNCSLFVFPSKEEGFGFPVLEAMCCGAPVIASNATSIPEVVGIDQAMFDPSDPGAIARKMEQALIDETFRSLLVKNSMVRSQLFSWEMTARRAWGAFEKHVGPCVPERQKKDDEGTLLCARLDIADKKKRLYVANCIARTFEDDGDKPQLLVDIGNLVQLDARTGIQRVVRSIIAQWLETPPEGYTVRPVYAVPQQSGYLYAHDFTLKQFDIDDGLSEDAPIDFGRRDIFLGLDLQLHVVPFQIPFLQLMRRHGVLVAFVVYDILAVQFPKYCSEGVYRYFPEWLKTIGAFDGLITISRAVMDDVRTWMEQNGPERERPLEYSWFHLGADIESSVPTSGLPDDASDILQAIAKRPSFLMVSTVEPRKGHVQALDAFEQLWSQGEDVNLVIVGKLGWKMDVFSGRLKTHREVGKRLFWLQGISDEYLEKIYKASSAVLMASEGEGFGLAVIEGARYNKPLILRDIPVFREIANEHAFYFSGLKAEDLSMALTRWLMMYKAGTVSMVASIHALTWKQSAESLFGRLLTMKKVLKQG